jgi:hypothetical protein
LFDVSVLSFSLHAVLKHIDRCVLGLDLMIEAFEFMALVPRQESRCFDGLIFRDAGA